MCVRSVPPVLTLFQLLRSVCHVLKDTSVMEALTLTLLNPFDTTTERFATRVHIAQKVLMIQSFAHQVPTTLNSVVRVSHLANFAKLAHLTQITVRRAVHLAVSLQTPWKDLNSAAVSVKIEFTLLSIIHADVAQVSISEVQTTSVRANPVMLLTVFLLC